MVRSTLRFRVEILILALALITLPFAAGAKEESKIQIRLTAISEHGNGNGNGNGLGGDAVRADVRTHLQGSRVILKLRARGLDADTEYVLLCKNSKGAADSAELARFTSRSNGSANLTQDLSKTDDPEAPADPRGKYLVIADDADVPTEIVGGWLYGEPQDDGPKTKIKEVTGLAADEDASPSGSVAARYDMRPNGHGKLSISMRHLPAGDYEILVGDDENLVATFTPNRAGNAKVDFQTRPIRGQGSGKVKQHRKKKHLGFDPRRKEILVQLAADSTVPESEPTPMFSGPMLAQIEGLNTCSPISNDSPLAGDTGFGTATLELQENCETAFDVAVEIADVVTEPASYDLYVDGVWIATFDATGDGSGTVMGFVRFDPTPDAGEGELLLDFPVGIGSLVEVFNAGADPSVDLPVLSGMLD